MECELFEWIAQLIDHASDLSDHLMYGIIFSLVVEQSIDFYTEYSVLKQN